MRTTNHSLRPLKGAGAVSEPAETGAADTNGVDVAVVVEREGACTEVFRIVVSAVREPSVAVELSSRQMVRR